MSTKKQEKKRLIRERSEEGQRAVRHAFMTERPLAFIYRWMPAARILAKYEFSGSKTNLGWFRKGNRVEEKHIA